MIKKILFTLCAIFITGCDGSGNAAVDKIITPPEQIVELEKSGSIPKLERGNSIEAIDLDANGVRDDIEVFIEANYTEAPQRAAVIQSAKALQEALLVDVTDIIAVKEVNNRISFSIHCIYSQFDGSNNSKQPAQVSLEIESLTTNTKQKLLAYLEFSKALNGTSWSTPEEDTCE
ncbi:MAG: hypothetical protein ACJAZP_000364 [Psychromonas sp.]|jgi:hypothetical protein|uniref:hypothetical protein n=1 Tax=Psychromonas sp. TaxID=1884585 RepID=UPI0039E2F188